MSHFVVWTPRRGRGAQWYDAHCMFCEQPLGIRFPGREDIASLVFEVKTERGTFSVSVTAHKRCRDNMSPIAAMMMVGHAGANLAAELQDQLN